MALPWLQSLSAFADTATPAAFPKRFAVLFMGNGINEDHWSAEGSGAEMKLSKTLSPLEPLKHKINVIDGLFNKAATGQGIHPAQTGSLLSGAHIQKGAIIQAGITRGPDDRQPRRPGYAAIQHRAGLRAADDGLPRDELLDGLQLAHFLADAGFAGSGRSLPFAGVRQPVREPRQPAEHEHSRPREGSRRGAQPRRSAPATRPSWTNISPACAKWKSASTACGRPRTRPTIWRSSRTAPPSPWSGRRTACRKTCGSTRA